MWLDALKLWKEHKIAAQVPSNATAQIMAESRARLVLYSHARDMACGARADGRFRTPVLVPALMPPAGSNRIVAERLADLGKVELYCRPTYRKHTHLRQAQSTCAVKFKSQAGSADGSTQSVHVRSRCHYPVRHALAIDKPRWAPPVAVALLWYSHLLSFDSVAQQTAVV